MYSIRLHYIMHNMLLKTSYYSFLTYYSKVTLSFWPPLIQFVYIDWEYEVTARLRNKDTVHVLQLQLENTLIVFSSYN